MYRVLCGTLHLLIELCFTNLEKQVTDRAGNSTVAATVEYSDILCPLRVSHFVYCFGMGRLTLRKNPAHILHLGTKVVWFPFVQAWFKSWILNPHTIWSRIHLVMQALVLGFYDFSTLYSKRGREYWERYFEPCDNSSFARSTLPADKNQGKLCTVVNLWFFRMMHCLIVL